MGEHYVAVAYDKLKWSNEPPRSATASTTTSSSKPSGNECRQRRAYGRGRYCSDDGRGDDDAEDRKANGYWYPDHAIYNATKDQLKAMPQFKY